MFKKQTWSPWLVIMAGVVAAMHIGKLPPTVPILQSQLGLSWQQVGFLLSAIQVAGSLCALALGMFASKVGLKNTLMLGLGVLACSSVLGSLATHFAALFAARLLEGFGFLCVILPAPALIRQLVKAERLKMMMAMWGAYMGLGVAISLFVTPLALQVCSWTQVWWGFAAMALLMLAIIAHQVHINTPMQQAKVSLLALLKQTLHHAPSWYLGMLFACYTSQWFAIMGFLPSIYMQANVAAAQAGVLTALVCLSNVFGSVLSGMLLQRGMLPLKLLWCGFVVMMLGTAVMFASAGHWPFAVQYLSVMAFSVFGGLIPAVVFAYVSILAPTPQLVAGSMGWIQQWSALGQFCLPPLMGAWVSWTGTWQHAWVLCVLLGSLGCWLSRRIQGLINQHQMA